MPLQARVDERIVELECVCRAPAEEGGLVCEAHGMRCHTRADPQLASFDADACLASRQPELDRAIATGRGQRGGRAASGEEAAPGSARGKTY